MDFVMHVSIAEEVLPDYDIDMAARLLMQIIAEHGDFNNAQITIRPLSEVIAS
jgi:hypothetical protein